MGQAGVGQASIVPEKMVDEISARVNGLTQYALANADRIATLADKLFGEPPPQPNSSGATASLVRSGRIGTLLDNLDNLRATLDTQSAQLDRLEPLI